MSEPAENHWPAGWPSVLVLNADTLDMNASTYRPASSVTAFLRAWKDTEHKWINHALREQTPLHCFRPEYRTALADIHNLMNEAAVPAPSNLIVYRGAYVPKLGRWRFTDRGYMATSLSERVANRFAARGVANYRGTPVIFRITIPRGYPIVPVDEIVDDFYHGQEQEIILPCETTLLLSPFRRRLGDTFIVNAKVGL